LNAEGVTCDVLVAGSGAAGFATPLTAQLEGLDVIMVEKAPLFGGTTAYSAGVVDTHQFGAARSRLHRLNYLAHHVGNRLDRAKAEAFLDNAPAMLDCFAREGFAVFSLVPTWADYCPDEPGRLAGRPIARAGDLRRAPSRKLFPKLRAPIKTMMAFGGMMIGRNDLPHIFQISRSLKPAAHVGLIVRRYGRDRLRRERQRLDRTHGRCGDRPRHTALAVVADCRTAPSGTGALSAPWSTRSASPLSRRPD